MNALVRKNNQERGPYTEAELRERLKSGVFSGSDLGQMEGQSEWKPLSEILLASVLATEQPSQAPVVAPGTNLIYSWLRRPRVLGGAVVLLLLIFGGINWLNKASEKRHEDAVAARQAAAMEQAQKQETAMLQQQQEQAAKARQTQLDQVKQMMAMTEKTQRDYQEKQKQEQEVQQRAEQAKVDAEQRKKEEGNRELEERRLAAEAKQKAAEAEFLKNRPTAVAATPGPVSSIAPNIILNSMPLGPFPKQRENVIVTDDGSRVLVIAAQGSRVQAVVDGQPGPVCRNVRLPKGDANAPELYAVPPFSPDKLRSAYIAELDAGKECVVVDGVQSPVYDKVAWLVFAPKGHHFAYLETERTSGGSGRGSKDSVYVVDNGKRGPVFDHLIELVGNKAPITSVFSEDGEHLGYIGLTTSANRNSQRVVVDGREEPQQHRLINQLRLSRDGKHVAYTATDYIPNNTGGGFDQQTVVVDGKAGRPFHRIRNLELSSDGSRYAYIGETPARNHAGVAWFEAHKNDPDTAQQNVVDNEKLGPRYDEVLDIQVSANGQRSGYIAYTQVGERHDYFVVDNGNASAAHDECSSLKISDDGSMLSFRTKSPQGMLLVVNNREFGPFYSIDNEVVYSADGKHWGCLVHATDLSESGMLLTDGVTHPVPKEAQHTGRITLEFRPDKGWFASSSQGEESSAFEVESATADSKVPSQVIYSRDRQHVVKVFSANQGSSSANQQVTLDNKPVGPLYLRVHHVQLSDDGQHVAFIGMYNGSGGTALTHVNFDGQEGPAWFTINGLAITPDGKHIAYSAEEKSQSGGVWHLVVDGFIGPPLENILGEEYWEKGRRMSAQPDGSVTFLAALKGQLGRYTYPAEALNFMPTIGQTASVTAGLHVLLNAGNLSDVARDLVLGPNETVYGIMAHGGEYGKGALFSCRTNGSDSKVLHSFYGDKETPPNGLAGDRENVWGLAGSSLFRYDIKKGEYNKVETSSEHLEGLRGIQHLKGLRGILPDGSLLGEQSDGSNEYHWWLLSHDGASLQKTPSREVPLNIAAIGPDGAIYSTDADSLYRQLSFYSSPILLHKFVDSPEEGTKPAPHVTFDSRGRIYGFTHPFQAGMYDAIYSVERDGSDFRVIVKQAEHLKIDALVAGDNGLLHGLRPRASGSQDFIFLTFPSTGGPITTLPGFTDNRYDHALVYHNTALFTATTRSILRLQIPSASGAAQLNPIVTIKTVAPVALASVEPVSFTTSSGETIPSAKTPDAQANAAIWHPPQPGSTIPLVSHQSSTPAKNGLTRFNTGNPAITNFGNGGAPGQGLSQQDATAFAVTNVNAMSAGDINALASFYADQVDYQDKGIITNYAVQSEFQQYFARWPQTNWQLTGAVAVQPVGPSRYQITFPVSFEAANPATNKRSAGVARETMTLEQDGNGAWKIVRERQTITSRKAEDRGRRSEREKVYEGKPIDRRNLPIPPGIPWPPNLPHP